MGTVVLIAETQSWIVGKLMTLALAFCNTDHDLKYNSPKKGIHVSRVVLSKHMLTIACGQRNRGCGRGWRRDEGKRLPPSFRSEAGASALAADGCNARGVSC